MHRLVLIAPVVLAPLSAHADQILGQAQLITSNNAIVLPGGPTLGLWSGGKYTETPDVLQIKGTGSTGDVSGMSVTPDGTNSAALLSSLAAGMPLQPEDYKLGTDPDDTLSFQRAANAAGPLGRYVQARPGKTYTLCAAIKIFTPGIIARGATIKLCPGFTYPTTTITIVTTGQTQTGTAQQPLNSVFYNANYLASSPTDDGWSVLGGVIDTRGSAVENDGQFHAIKARMARNVTVDGVTVYGGGNCTAFQADDVTRVSNSRCYNVRNAGYDHWEGPTNALVENSVVVCGPRVNNNGADGGVMFTGASTALADKQGANLTSRNNKISGGCNAGIFVNQLSPGSSLTNFASEGDTIDASGNTSMIGVLVEGNTQGGHISGLTLKNGNGPAALLLRPDIIATSTGNTTSGKPARINVSASSILDWTTAPSNYSPATFYGFGHSVTGLSILGGTNNTYTTTENNSITISGTFNATTSTYGAYNCLASSCTVPGVVTIPTASPQTTVH